MAKRTIHYRCEQCGKLHMAQVYEGVDVAKEPQFRSRVMDASIFDFACPDCGYVNGIIYPFVYHDPDRRFLIRLIDQTVTGDPFTSLFDTEEETDAAIKGVVEDMKQRYRFRVVRTPNDLMEKIAIFEAGYDDRVIELMKIFLLSSRNDSSILHLYFAPTDDGPVFLMEIEAGFTGSIPLEETLYDSIAAKTQEAMNPADTEIDSLWASKFFDRMN